MKTLRVNILYTVCTGEARLGRGAITELLRYGKNCVLKTCIWLFLISGQVSIVPAASESFSRMDMWTVSHTVRRGV